MRRIPLAFLLVLACATRASAQPPPDAEGDMLAPTEPQEPTAAPASSTPTSSTPSTTPTTTTSSTSAARASSTGATPAPTTTRRSDPAPAPTSSPTGREGEARGRPEGDDDEDDDDGRTADLLWIEAGFGYAYADLVSFNADNFLPGVDELEGNGFMAHVAAGLRVFFLTLGARGWLANFPQFDLWALVADVALRLPIPVVEPYVRFGIGYAFVGQADYTKPMDSDVSVFGLVVEGGLGVDVYLNSILSIGAGLDLAFLNLTRQRVDMCSSSTASPDCNIMMIDFEETGDAAGLSVRAHGHLALHF